MRSLGPAGVLLLCGAAACGSAASTPADAGLAPADAGSADAARLDAPPPPGPCEAFAESSDTPLAVPDDGASESVITLPAVAADVVQTVVVQVDIAHTYPRDIVLSLVSPAGTEVVLARDQTSAYQAARFAPAGFTGEPAEGAWTLRVADDALGDAGSLVGWSIRIDACTPPACAGATLHVAQGLGPNDGQVLFPVAAPDLPVAAARVALSASFPYDAYLDIDLYAPAGKVALSDGNGSSGNDYQGTVFDDAADLSIVDGLPPFTGAYRPQQPLALLTGTPASGPWLLAVFSHEPAPGAYDSPATLSIEQSYLEVDLCEQLCPEGTTAVRYDSPGGAILVGDAGSLAGSAVVVSALGADVTLRSPAGTAVHLGASDEGFHSTVFADDAGRALAEGTAPYEGRFRPLEPLAALDGEAAAGSWTLDPGSGTIFEWAIDLCLR